MSKEYPCVYHENGECKKFSGDGITSYCVLGPCPDEAQSNANRIRAMSDGELARIFVDAVSNGCPPAVDWDCCKDEYGWDGCEECWKNWLRRPAEGGGEIEGKEEI